MKILAVVPGHVKIAERGWKYTITQMVENKGYLHVPSDTSYPTASAAKQAMRERVAFLRKKHCV